MRRLSKAAYEVLAIVAYHQPVSRAEIEAVRGVALSKGVLDALMEAGWVRMRGRRRSPGSPGGLRNDGRLPGALRPAPRWPTCRVRAT